MLFGLIAGIAIGYIFKPQLDKVVLRIVKMVRNTRDNIKGKNRNSDDDQY